jgi:hypothetical protein
MCLNQATWAARDDVQTYCRIAVLRWAVGRWATRRDHVGHRHPLLYSTEEEVARERDRTNHAGNVAPAGDVEQGPGSHHLLLDSGADTIGWHLAHHHRITVSRATIYRTIRRADLVTPAPQKRQRSSYIRFQAEQPNETWQADFTHWTLADGIDTEILTWLDETLLARLNVRQKNSNRTTPPPAGRSNVSNKQ